MSSGVKINVLTLGILAVVLVMAAPGLRRMDWTAQRIAGAVIAAVSLAAIVAARFQLGAAFSVRAKARKLVTTGVFAKVRNPIYVFSEFFCAGVAFFSGQWWIVAVGAAIIPLQVWRARNEARALREAFGEEYERYRQQTWF
jgi:protein-S-isoprenylcysteine O-methyltransferase Ste14